jgi:hypothetical protein
LPKGCSRPSGTIPGWPFSTKEDELRAQGEFTLRLSDFNIRPISVAGGLLKLRDEVKLSFDIMARALR